MHPHEVKLRDTLATAFGIDPSRVSETASVDTVPEWDSLKHMNLILALEERFDVVLTEEEAVQILSLPLIRIVLREHGVPFG